MLSRNYSSSNSPELLRVLQGKLPVSLQDRWNRHVTDVKDKGRVVGLQNFVRLIYKEIALVNDHLCSCDIMSNQSQSLLVER